MPVNEIDESIVVENLTQSFMQKEEVGAAASKYEAKSRVFPTKMVLFVLGQGATTHVSACL